MNLMQLPDESNSKRQISNEKHIAYRIGLQEISKVIQDYERDEREGNSWSSKAVLRAERKCKGNEDLETKTQIRS